MSVAAVDPVYSVRPHQREKSFIEKHQGKLLLFALCQIVTLGAAIATVIAYRKTCSDKVKTAAIVCTAASTPSIVAIVALFFCCLVASQEKKDSCVLTSAGVLSLVWGGGVIACLIESFKPCP